MKRVVIFMVLAAVLSPAAYAQEEVLNHGEVGVFANYFRLRDSASGNFWGLGGRASFNVHKYAQIEAELAYDFGRSVAEGFTEPVTGTIAFGRSDLRVLHGLFGPKFQAPGALRPFIVLKGGFINFRFDDRPATFGTVGSTLTDLRSDNVHGVFYPGAGFEVFAGPIGFRFEVGDEMYFADGAKHNLRMILGPQLRF